jgi:hypothetical protein
VKRLPCIRHYYSRWFAFWKTGPHVSPRRPLIFPWTRGTRGTALAAKASVAGRPTCQGMTAPPNSPFQAREETHS